MKYLLASLIAVGLVGGSQIATYGSCGNKMHNKQNLGKMKTLEQSTDVELGEKIITFKERERRTKGDENDTSSKNHFSTIPY